MNFVEAAYMVLKGTDKPHRAEAIVKKAVEKGWLKTKGKTPEQTMRVAITQEINNRTDARFDHAGPMTFKLRTAGVETDVNNQEPDDEPVAKDPSGEEIDDDTRRYDFTGVAGEHWVQSKLLFEGYETSRPVPDMGVDLVARKDRNSFYLQVKTANKKGNAYNFPLRERAFKRLKDVGAYHVFVMRNPESEAIRCALLPRSFMKEMIKAKKIGLVNMGKTNKGYQVRIAEKDGTYSIKGNDVSVHVDNWDL